MIRKDGNRPVFKSTDIRTAIARISEDKTVIALYAFGSQIRGGLKPLSDLDFGILLASTLDKRLRFHKSIALLAIFNDILKTDEIDLVVLNDSPMGFAYQILKTGHLLHCRDKSQLADFIERTVKRYLDFRPVKDLFDRAFLEGVGFHG